MRKTIKEILEETFNNQRAWNYYSNQNFSNLPLKSIKESKLFIREFFRLSGKGEHELQDQIDKLGSRAVHVVSAFLLGHYLYQNTIFKNKIDKEIELLKDGWELKSEVEFSFMWFLTCLFHDIGFNMETNQFKYKSFEELSNEMPEISGIPKFYNAVYKNYFEYRIKEHCKNDHGIMVGHIMYKELCDIREKAESMPNDEQKNLNWEKNLEKIFAFCSWNVLAHNIWFGKKLKKKDVDIYEKYKIQDLLLETDEYKINYEEHPFFFLFCLVDTIEPYKRILNLNMLDQVYLEIEDDKIKISTDLKCNCGKTIFKQVNSLKDWLTSTGKINNKVEISLKNNQ